jgi:beta-xylosidase
MNHAESLAEHLHELHVSSGEIITGRNLAAHIAEYETENDVEFTPAEILKATRDAGEAFVDSMQENAQHCTHFADEAEREEYVESLEAMRPRNVRRAAIAEILAPAL